MDRGAWQATVHGAAKELDTVVTKHAHTYGFYYKTFPLFGVVCVLRAPYFLFAYSVCSLCFVTGPLPMCPEPWMSVWFGE